MNLKKQFALTLASVGLGAALIGGGTFAYFSDTEKVENTFAAGTLDLAANPTTVFNLKDLGPGDAMTRTFDIKNSGTLDIKKVLLSSTYNVTDAKGDNGSDDFGDHLRVEFLKSDGITVVYQDTLKELLNKKPDISNYFWGINGLPKGASDKIIVRIKFVDNGKDQNIFQGDKLDLTWNLEAQQADGRER